MARNIDTPDGRDSITPTGREGREHMVARRVLSDGSSVHVGQEIVCRDQDFEGTFRVKSVGSGRVAIDMGGGIAMPIPRRTLAGTDAGLGEGRLEELVSRAAFADAEPSLSS